jgi:DNA ligase (NAD+)
MVTRGDGKVGEDISPNIPFMTSIPNKIPDLGHVFIRGEAIVNWNNFKEHLANEFENPRNSASGLIRSKSKVELLKYLSFVAYDYYGPERIKRISKETEILAYLSQQLKFEIPKICRTADTPGEAVAIYEQYDKQWRDELPWMTDGLVMKVNDLNLQNKLGDRGGRPEHSIALKPTPKACVTKVIGLTWEQGLSGRYTPVAQVEPTPLDGVTLRNVNMHNLDFLGLWVKKGFGIGATITVLRSGDVIPYPQSVIIPAQLS